MKKIPKKDRTCKPWITPGLLRCIRHKDKLHLDAKNHPDNDMKQLIYRRYKTFCDRIVNNNKNSFEKQKIENSLSNLKQTWNTIREVTNTNKTKTVPIDLLHASKTEQESIEQVNAFFSNIGRNLAEEIMNSISTDSIPTSTPTLPNSLILLPTDPSEVEHILLSLKNNSSSGWDNIPTTFLKQARHIIIPPLVKLLNMCIEQGKFPKVFKKAIIHPIHKGGDRCRVNNYRPISVLPALSKIFEKILNIRLVKYLNKYNILASQQFGFRAGRSAEDAVIGLSTSIAESLDKHEKSIAVFLDLAKAFDTVHIPLLLKKMEHIGVRGSCLDLFRHYLTDRTQFVKIGNYVSSESLISYGVPQGSILGPSLFLIYINELCLSKLPNANIFSYADDTAILVSSRSWSETYSLAETSLNIIKDWLDANLLSLNINKTKYIAFSLRKPSAPPDFLTLKIHKCSPSLISSCDCQCIERVSEIKYLGVVIDQHMTWQPHIKTITNRVRNLIWIFKKLRHITDFKLLISIYQALCQSIITYCITAWGGACKTHMLLAERAQRSLLKVMTFKPFRFPTKDLYSICKMLSIRQLYILNTITSQHLKTPYDPSDPQHTRRRNRDLSTIVSPKKYNTTFIHTQYCCLAPFLYKKANLKLDIYPLNKHNLKITVRNWLLSLSYDETENFFVIQK